MMEDFQMKRPVTASGSGPLRAAPVDETLATFPVLADYLTSLFYDGDPPVPRETATLLLFAQDGSFRACLRDRAERRCLWVATPSWADLLTVLELGLSDENAVWREDRLSGAETAKRIPPSRK
jgi:hypothetical protein